MAHTHTPVSCAWQQQLVYQCITLLSYALTKPHCHSHPNAPAATLQTTVAWEAVSLAAPPEAGTEVDVPHPASTGTGKSTPKT